MTMLLARSCYTVLAFAALACSSAADAPPPDDDSTTAGGSGGSSSLAQSDPGALATGGSQTVSVGGAGGAPSSNAGTGGAGNAQAMGGAAGRAGNAQATGGAAGQNVASDAGSRPAITCTAGSMNTALPAGAPALVSGVWKNITPVSHAGHEGDSAWIIGQGLAMDPCAPATLYWGNTPFEAQNGGVFRTTDGGGSWTRIGQVAPAFPGASDHLDEPLHVRIDPNNTQHLYAGDGVRGGSQGFFVSMDGGATFVKPKGFNDATKAAGIDNQDIYDVAVDPTDFKHVLITFHYRWGWTDTKWNTNSGVMESKDGGDSWLVHDPVMGWGSGHAIAFLNEPSLGLGDSRTWLLGTQDNGYWRTTDAGQTWKKVSDNKLMHGGGAIYYNAKGMLFATGSPSNMRSTDNGVTWSLGGPGNSTEVFGDGEHLWTGPVWGNGPIYSSPENDGVTWTPYPNGTFKSGGPYEMVFDRANRILYASMWMAGIWAMKLP